MLMPPPWQRLRQHYGFAVRCAPLLLLFLCQGLPLVGRPLLLLGGVAALAPHTDRRHAVLVGILSGAVWSVFADHPCHAAVLGAVGWLGASFPHRVSGAVLAAAVGTLLLCPSSFGMTVLLTPPSYGLFALIFSQRRVRYAA